MHGPVMLASCRGSHVQWLGEQYVRLGSSTGVVLPQNNNSSDGSILLPIMIKMIKVTTCFHSVVFFYSVQFQQPHVLNICRLLVPLHGWFFCCIPSTTQCFNLLVLITPGAKTTAFCFNTGFLCRTYINICCVNLRRLSRPFAHNRSPSGAQYPGPRTWDSKLDWH